MQINIYKKKKKLVLPMKTLKYIVVIDKKTLLIFNNF